MSNLCLASQHLSPKTELCSISVPSCLVCDTGHAEIWLNYRYFCTLHDAQPSGS